MSKVLIVILSAILVIGVMVLYTEGNKAKVAAVETYVQHTDNKQIPEWKTYTPDEHFYLDSPFPITWDKKEVTTDGQSYQVFAGVTPDHYSDLAFSALSMPITDADYASFQVKETIHSEKSTFEKEIDFQWTEEPVTCSGMPATLTSSSYKINNTPAQVKTLYVIDQNLVWNIRVSSFLLGDKFPEYSKRIIDSIQFKP